MTAQLDAAAADPARIEAAGRTIASLQTGRRGDPVALLVPGYTGSKEDFAPLLGPLAAAGLHAVAIDLPGQFESPGFASAADYTVDALGAVVRAVAATLGERVLLLGHSFGGLVCRSAVIAEPSRFASLVLLSSGPAHLDGRRRRNIDVMRPLLASAGLPGVYAAMMGAAAAEPGFVAPPPELAEFLERRFLGGSVEMLDGMGAALSHEPDRVAELRATGVPVLVLHGADDDAWLPAIQQDMARRLGARHVVVEGAAHSAAVENPDATIAALLDFWAP